MAEALIKVVIKYHGLSDFIVTDQKFLFTLKFMSFFCYYLNAKRYLSTAFYLQIDRQTQRQNSNIKAYL